MRLNRKLLLIFIVISLSCFAGWSVFAQRRNAQRIVWEYKLVTFPTGDPLAELNAEFDAIIKGKPVTKEPETSLNKLGAQGWELVTIMRDGGNSPTVYVFKRAK